MNKNKLIYKKNKKKKPNLTRKFKQQNLRAYTGTRTFANTALATDLLLESILNRIISFLHEIEENTLQGLKPRESRESSGGPVNSEGHQSSTDYARMKR